MADVFISYSRKDTDAAKHLASALQAEGLSVWWDPEVKPGERYLPLIERELDAASATLVLWTQNSRDSRWVQEEANRSEGDGKLVPVRIGKVKLPLGFGMIQTEDLTDWDGDRNAEVWQRVMLQLNALTGHTQRDVGGGIATSSEPTGSQGSALFHIMIVMVLLGALGGFLWIGSIWLSGAISVALLALVLFRFAEMDLSPGRKALARQWFLPVEGRVKVRTIEAFYNMFVSVFGRKHLSWRCLRNSALASTLFLAIIFLLLDSTVGSGYLSPLKEPWEGYQVDGWVIIIGIGGLFANFFGDYISLWETRLVLTLVVRKKIPLWLGVAADVVFTCIVYLATLFVMLQPVTFLFGGSWFSISEFYRDLIQPFITVIVSGDIVYDSGERVVHHGGLVANLGSGLVTAFITSIWLWMAVFIGPVARLFLWTRRSGLTALGRLFNGAEQPFTALGYIAAIFTLMLGVIGWSLTRFAG